LPNQNALKKYLVGTSCLLQQLLGTHFGFFNFNASFCLIPYSCDKDTSFLLGFHYTGINSYVMATSVLVKRAWVHFLTPGSRGAECTHQRWTFSTAKMGVHRVRTEDGPRVTPEACSDVVRESMDYWQKKLQVPC